MKSVITAVILFAVAIGAHASDGKDDKNKKKAAAPAPQAVTIPKDAVPNPTAPLHLYGQKGKKWDYVKTPFGVIKVPGRRMRRPSAPPDFSTTKAIDKGDTVRFERPSPFGPFVWEKKKSDLTDDERHLLDAQNAKTEQKND